MARLTDPVILTCYANALANWSFSGYVVFKKEAVAWLRSDLEGFTQRRFAELLFDYVRAGGEIDQALETRPEWSVHEFHYDLRPMVAGRRLYVETRLISGDSDDPDDPQVYVVNIHNV